MTQPLVPPTVLDPDRALSAERDTMTSEDHRNRAEKLERALRETCAYGRQLWDDVARARQYLYDSLPPDPRHPDSDRVGTRPTGPDDEVGWQRWIDAYAELTSVLSGPQGDSGFGVGEAKRAAELRREAPVARLRAAHPHVAAAAENVAPEPAPAFAHPTKPERRSQARSIALGVLVVLALRGVRPRARR